MEEEQEPVVVKYHQPSQAETGQTDQLNILDSNDDTHKEETKVPAMLLMPDASGTGDAVS